MPWLRRLLKIKDQQPSSQDDSGDLIGAHEPEEAQRKKAGFVDGRHYTAYVEKIKQLKREKRHQEAIGILLRIVDATEKESEISGWGVAPWYYEQLAIVYRKEKRYDDEVRMLERYEAQTKAPGVGPSKIAERLVKARELAVKYAQT